MSNSRTNKSVIISDNLETRDGQKNNRYATENSNEVLNLWSEYNQNFLQQTLLIQKLSRISFNRLAYLLAQL